jgi:hypothetical protein
MAALPVKMPRDYLTMLWLNLPPAIEPLQSDAGHGQAHLEGIAHHGTEIRVLPGTRGRQAFWLMPPPSQCRNLIEIVKLMVKLQSALKNR